MTIVRKVIVGFFDIVYRVLLEYSKWVLLVIVGIISADVFSRNVFGGSIMWGQEVALLLVVWMCFLSMAIGAEKEAHIAIELFYHRFPKPVCRVLDTINKSIIVAIGVFFTYYGTNLTISTWKSTLAVTKWPGGMLYIMIPVGGACMAFFALLDMIGWKKYKHTNLYNEEEIDIYDLPTEEKKADKA